MSDKQSEQRQRNKERRLDKCRHFNGTINEFCNLNISYASVTSYPESRKTEPPAFQKAMACFKSDDEECSKTCDKREFFTVEDVEEHYQKLHESMKQYSIDYENDICPTHKAPMTKTQIGRCVYAMPCGCRLGQGKLPKSYKPKHQQ